MNDSKRCVMFLILGLLIGFLLTYLLIPKRVAHIDSEGEIILSVDGYNYSANEYYKDLKDKDNLTILLRNLDIYLTKRIYGDKDDEASEYANNKYNEGLKNYTYYGKSEKDYLSDNGFSNKDELINYIKDDYYINLYQKDYIKSLINEDDIEDYYKKYTYNKKDLVMISGDSKILNNIIKDINNKVDFVNIQSKYSNINFQELDGYYVYDNSVSEDMNNNIKKLHKGNVSNVINDSTFGNVIIYIKDESDKPSLDDAKDDILNAIGSSMLNNEPNLTYKAMIKLQEDNNIKIEDSNILKEYNEYKDKYNN